MSELSGYQEYARIAIDDYAKKDTPARLMLVDAVRDLKVERMLDIGCGAGQEMLPFAEHKRTFCVGIDIGEELSEAVNRLSKEFHSPDKIKFSRAMGEELPFPESCFDVVICRVALPYMHNAKTISEVSRVLKPNGLFLLKTHSPRFLTEMLKERLKSINPRQIAYPILCLVNSFFRDISGKQLYKGFWSGKQVYQTRAGLDREFARNKLTIVGTLPDDNPLSPSFLVRKT